MNDRATQSISEKTLRLLLTKTRSDKEDAKRRLFEQKEVIAVMNKHLNVLRNQLTCLEAQLEKGSLSQRAKRGTRISRQSLIDTMQFTGACLVSCDEQKILLAIKQREREHEERICCSIKARVAKFLEREDLLTKKLELRQRLNRSIEEQKEALEVEERYSHRLSCNLDDLKSLECVT